MKKTKIVGICFVILTFVVLVSSVKIGKAIYLPPPIDDPGNGGTPHDIPLTTSIPIESITIQNTFGLQIYTFSPIHQILIKITIINMVN